MDCTTREPYGANNTLLVDRQQYLSPDRDSTARRDSTDSTARRDSTDSTARRDSTDSATRRDSTD